MWQIFLLVSISCLSTLTNGQQQKQKPPPPQITNFRSKDLINPEQVKFRTDNALVLPCGATGNNLKWIWKLNDTAIPDSAYGPFGGKFKLSSIGTLTGSNLGSSESGTYQCFVRDTVSTVETFSRKIKVAVTVVGEFNNEDPVVKNVNLGSPFTFACPPHTLSYGVSFTWEGENKIQFKRNERRGISPTNGDLFIMFVTQEDIDEINGLQGIKCTMSAANTYFSSGALTLAKPAGQTDPNTPSAPTWNVRPSLVEYAVEGRNKTFYCLATGRPAPQITWKKNGVTLVHGKDSFEIPNAFQGRLLNIINVRKDLHEDQYSCEAENSQSAGNPIIHNINLQVEVAPKWTSGSPPEDKKQIDINGNGTLTCDVTAVPAASFLWYKDGNRIQSSTVQVRLDNNKLHFKDIRLEDAGMYQCVAENKHGMIVSSTWVHVLAIAPSFEKNGFGPFYLFNEREGRLKCDPEAAPRPSQFKWYKEGEELTSARYSVTADGTLVINTVNRGDAGRYTCYAKNFLGEATSDPSSATVLNKTEIIVAPEDQKTVEGSRVDLRCEAVADASLELKYFWKRDNAIIDYNNKIQWLEGKNVLTIGDITVDDAGIYTCVAYTPKPKESRDERSATVDIAGAPNPPTNLQITNCYNRTTTLTWITGAPNNASITHFLVEQKSEYPDDVYRVIANVTNPNATSVMLNLTGWARLHFRMRAVNRFGPSRASLPTTQLCETKVGAPDKYPDNLRGVPKKAEQLDIAWTAMPMVDWNAPDLYYLLWYRKRGSDDWLPVERFSDPSIDKFSVPNPGYYVAWEFQIQAGNDQAPGPKSPIVWSYSGQNPPAGRPENVNVVAVSARTVKLTWTRVTVARGSVDGYRVYFWGQRRDIAAKRRRRAIPSYATFVDVPGGNTESYTVTDLKPYTDYSMAMKAFNSGGEGPASIEVFAPTNEAEPGPPSEVNVYAFAKYILVTWQPPVEPNGIITGYRVGSATYIGSEPTDVVVDKQEVGQDVRRKLLDDRKPEENYVVEIQAATSIGWGTLVKKTTTTVAWAAPAKPNRPTVEGTDVDKVRVTYNFGLGGGYTHEFLVMYRRKLEGEEFQNTSWVDHFATQSTEIGDLSPGLYQFKTVARNDYPSKDNRQESPASDITEARPLPGVVNAGKRATTPIHQTAWFIALLVLIAILLIVLLIFVLYTRHQGAKYQVGKRERKRAALIEREPYDEEEGAFSNASRTENPPPYQSEGSLHKGQDSDRDSLDDYGEGPQFNEDGSFIEEYGDEKKVHPDEKDQSALATFV